MNGKSWSIPAGLVFKKYYCKDCGNKLEKEKTHRVVTKDDPDYFQYQDYNTFPHRDYDVYSYRFKCSFCNKSISYNEQCIYDRIQRENKTKILSSSEIKDNYLNEKNIVKKHSLIISISVIVIFFSLFLALYYFFGEGDFIPVLVMCCIFMIISIVGIIRGHKGKYVLKKNRDYSFDKENLLEKLHTYASNNRFLINQSNTCYCFYCKKKFDAKDVKEFIGENDNTALCPLCEIDDVLPDSIDESLDDLIIYEMNKYWF